MALSPTSIAAAKQVATRNILNPLLWLCALISAPAAAGSAFAPASILTVLLILALVPPAFTLLAYTYWTFKDPNRLQSEEFVLQQQWVAAQAQIGDNRTNEMITLDVSQRNLTANSALIEDGSNG